MPDPIIINGKKFITSKQGASLTGYARDYVGQLVRLGKVEGKVVDKTLFVSQESLLAHLESRNGNSKVVENSFKLAIAESTLSAQSSKSVSITKSSGDFLPKLNKINKSSAPLIIKSAPKAEPKLVSKFKVQNEVVESVSKITPYADAIGKISSFALKHAIGFAVVLALLSTSYASIHKPESFLENISKVFTPVNLEKDNTENVAGVFSAINGIARKVNYEINDFFGIGNGAQTTIVQLPSKVITATSTVVREVVRDIGTTTIVRYSNPSTPSATVVVDNSSAIDALTADIESYKIFQQSQIDKVFDSLSRRSTSSGDTTTIINNNAEGTTTLTNLTVTNTSTSSIPKLNVTSSFTLNGDTIVDFVGSGLELSDGVLTATAGSGFSTTSSDFHFDNRLAATTTLNNITTLRGLTDLITVNATTTSLSIGSDYITDLTGSGLTVVNGALTVSGASGFSTTSADYWETLQTRWATTSSTYFLSTKSTSDLAEGSNLYFTNNRFDTRLAATTSLPNIGSLAGLGNIGSTTGTTTLLGATIFSRNVGIGTTNPTAALEFSGVASGVRIGFESTNRYGLGYGVTGGQTHSYIAANRSSGVAAVSLGGQVTDGTAANYVPHLTVLASTGNVGIGTTSPYAKLSVAGQTVAQYFTATSTTATSTFPLLSSTAFALGSDYITDLTGANLSIVNGALTVTLDGAFSTTSADYWETLQTRWSTTSSTYFLSTKSTSDLAEGSNLYFTNNRFDTRLAATTTLNNITTLRGLTDIIATRATTTNATSTNFFATTASSTNLYTSTLTAGSNALVVTSSGNVGIGSAAPSTPLQVSGAIRTNRIGTTGQYIEVDGGDASSMYFTASSATSAQKKLLISNLVTGGAASSLSGISFRVGESTSPITAATIDYLGNFGIGTTSPYAKLSVAGQTVAQYFTATSTTATSTFPLLSSTAFALGSDYITDLTGANLSIVNGALTVTLDGAFSTTSADYWETLQTRWSTTSSTYFLSTKSTSDLAEGTNLYYTNSRFDTRLAATTSLPNLNTLSGLASVGSTTGTTTLLGATIFSRNVGIGTASPGYPLHVYSTTGTYGLRVEGKMAYIDDRVLIAGPNQNPDVYLYESSARGGWVNWNKTGGYLSLGTRTASTNYSDAVIIKDGSVGIGTTSPYAKLSVAGQTVAQYFTATSTTATSTFPLLSSTAFALGSDYITDLTGANLSIVNGALTVTLDGAFSTTSADYWENLQTRWSTTSSTYFLSTKSTSDLAEGSNLYFTNNRFDTRLAATTTLNNITTLRGLTDIISTRATTTNATSTNFFATTASSTNLYTSTLTAGSNTLVVTSSGNVGIGTNSPGTNGLTLGDTTSTGNYVRVLGSDAENTYAVFSGERKYPRFDLVDTFAGGSTFSFWNLGNTMRFGTNTGTAANAAWYTKSGNAGDVIFNGKIGISTTSPYAKLSVVGQTVSEYFTATSTTATSTFPLLSSTAFALGSDYITDLTGANLSIVNGALTVTLDGAFSTTSADYWETLQTRWATTSDSYAFDTRLAATTTLNNLTQIGNQSSFSFGNATGSSLYITSLDCSLYSNGGKLTTDSSGQVTCANDTSGSGGGGGSDVNWTFFNGSGISVSTTTNQVVIGASATSSLQKLQVSGGVYVIGNVGIGTTSPYESLSVNGNAVFNGYTLSSYFTATSTTATSTLPNLSTTKLLLGSDYITDITGSGLSIVNGALTVDSSGNWATTSDSYAFDTRLAATTTLNNITTLGSLSLPLTQTTGTLSVSRGGTGQTSFGQGWLASDGTTITSSTSPTVAYITATSTTATSTLHGNSYGADGIVLGANDKIYSSDGLSLFDTSNALSRFAFSTNNTYTASAAGQHRFNIGASQVVVIDASGNLGIGTSSPYAKLSVTNTGTGPSFLVEDSTSPDTTPFIVDASGNVGIGTSTPLQKFVVTGQGVFASNVVSPDPGDVSGNSLRVGYYSVGDYGYINAINSGVAVKNLILNTNQSGQSGNVGVGTTSPASKLHIEGTNSITGGLSIYSTAGTANGRLAIYPSGNTSVAFQKLSSNGVVSFLNSSGSEEFRIAADGNVGIGTTSPYAKLSVAGQTVAQYFTATSTTATSTFPLLSSTAFALGSDYITDLTGANLSVVNGALTVTLDGAFSTTSADYWETLQTRWATTSDSYAFDTRLAATTTLNNITTLRGLTDIISTRATTTNATSTNFFATTASTTDLFVGGSLGIGTSSPQAKLSFADHTTAAGGIKFGSDVNLYRVGSGVLKTDTAFYAAQGFYAPDNFGFNNSSTGNNAFFKVNTNGPLISRNISDSNPSLIVHQVNAGSTGDILQLKNNASTLFVVQQDGDVGIGTTSPYARLSVAGQTVSEYFTATSTSATSTFPLLSTNALSLNGQFVTSLWSTTSSTYFLSTKSTSDLAEGSNLYFTNNRFDTRLAATTSLPNLNTLSGLASIGSTTGTTTVLGAAIFNGNVGIGTTTPASKLALAGGNFIHTASGNPDIIGTYGTSGQTSGVYVSGNYAYVVEGSAGIRVVNISIPSSPTSVGIYNTSGDAQGVQVSGKYAYVADGNSGLQIVDVSNPSSPSLVGGYDTTGYAYDIYVSGKYAYVADYTSGLQIIDVSNPAAPSLVGTYDTPDQALGVYVSGKYAYVADRTTGLMIFNISNPAAPSLVGSAVTTSATDVYVSGKYAYVADSIAGLRIIDISNPASPSVTGTYNTPGLSEDVYVSGKYAYVADNSAGFYIIDISNPAAPSLVGSYDTSGNTYGVYVSGKYAYVADYLAGFKVFDINGTETPSLFAGNINTNDLTVSENIDIGNNLYIRNGLNVGNGGIFTDGVLSVAGTSTSYISGNLGIGTTSPYAKLSVAGQTVSEYFTATSTTATSTFPLLSTNALSLNGQFVTSLWATTSANFAFDTRLAATTTLNNITTLGSLSLPLTQTTGTLSVSRGGTGQTSFGQGWLHSDGTTITSSTSPTVAYITSTSSATSTFAGGINISGAGCFAINGACIGGGSALSGSGVANKVAYWTGTGNLSYSDAFGWNGTTGQLTAPTFESTASSSILKLDDTTILKADITSGNFFAGVNSGNTTPTGQYNTAVGQYTLNALTGGNGNSAFGRGALSSVTDGLNNVGIGYNAGIFIDTGSGNVSIGTNSLSNVSNGDNNTALGTNAGAGLVSGSNNLLLGYNADVLSSSLTNSTAIGYNAKVAISDAIVLGTSGIKVGVGTSTPFAALSVDGQTAANYFTAVSTTATSTLPLLSTNALSLNGQFVTSLWATTSDSYAFDTRLAATSTLNRLSTLDGLVSIGSSTGTTYLKGSTNISPSTAGVGSTLDHATEFPNSYVSGGAMFSAISSTGMANIGVKSKASNKYSFFDQTNDVGSSLLFGTYGSAYPGTQLGQTIAGNSFIYTYLNSKLTIGTYGTGELTFGTNNLGRMTVASGGNIGIGTTSPYAKLSVAGQTVSEYFTATSTTATSTFPLLSTNALSLNGQFVTSLWATTSANFAFDTRLAATTTLNNITTLGSLSLPLTQTTGTLSVSRGGTGQTSFGQGWLASDGTTITSSTSPTVAYITATSTTATSTFQNIQSVQSTTTRLFVGGTASIGTDSQSGSLNIARSDSSNLISLSRGATTMDFNFASSFPTIVTNTGILRLTDSVSEDTIKTSYLVSPNYKGLTEEPTCMIMAVNESLENTIGLGGSSSQCNAATSIRFYTGETSTTLTGAERMRIDSNGNLGIGTTSPYAKLSVVGQTVSEYFTATSTTATSTFPLLSTNALSLNGQFVTSLWATTSANFAFDTRLAATTSLPNIGSLAGLGNIGSTTGTTTLLGATIFNGFVGIGVTNPTEQLEIGDTLKVNNEIHIGAAGSAGDAGLYFNNDSNTGLFSPGADNFGISTAGAERIRINENGFVGIGTTSPSAQFSISGTGAYIDTAGNVPFGDSSLYIRNTGSSGTYAQIKTESATGVNFLVTNSGNVAIGNSSPEGKLQILKTGTYSTTDSTTASQVFENGDGLSVGYTGGMSWIVRNAALTQGAFISAYNEDGSGSMGLAFGTRVGGGTLTERLMIGSSGNIGIGSSTPYERLSVNGNAVINGAIRTSSITATSTTVDSVFSRLSVTSGTTTNATSTNFFATTASTTDLFSGGKIGVGTSTPSAKVEIYNSEASVSLAIDGNAGGIDIARIYRGQAGSGSGWGAAWSVASNNPQMKFLQSASSQSAGTIVSAIGYDSSGGGFFIATSSVNTGLRGVEPFFIKASTGNVGLGGTTTPWRSISMVGTVAMNGLTTAAGTPSSICMNTATKEITVNAATSCVVSDRDQKQQIQPLTVNGLDALNAIKTVTFAYNDIPGRSRIGFIAQDLQSVDNRLGDAFDKNGIARSIDIPAIMSITVKAVQELDTKVNTQASSTASQFLSALNVKPTTADNFLVNGDLKFKNNFTIKGDDMKYLYIKSNTGSDVITFADNGNVGIGTSTPAYKLQIVGDIAATAFVNVSTREAKKNITYLNDDAKMDALEALSKIKIANYRYKTDSDSDPLRLGLIAEEAPASVLSASGKGVDLYKLTTFTLAAVQAQQKKIENIDTRLAALEAIVASSTPAVSEGLIASVISAIKDLTLNKLEIGSQSKPSGITLYDDESGEPYCIKMSGGKMKSTPGVCGTVVIEEKPAPIVVPTPQNTPAQAPTPSSQNNATTTTPVATTTVPVVVQPVVTASSTPSSSGSSAPAPAPAPVVEAPATVETKSEAPKEEVKVEAPKVEETSAPVASTPAPAPTPTSATTPAPSAPSSESAPLNP